MKTVTVIIPTFNRWPTICLAIDSVLNQSYQKTECMVVDDASADNTPALLKDRYGSRISIVPNKTNKGQSFCRNLGVESCKSDCICFLDSDDILEKDAVEQRVSLLNEAPDKISIAFGLFRTPRMSQHPFLHQKKRGDELLLAEYLREKSWCNNNGFLIDRECFLCDGRYDVCLRNKEDVELILRLLCKHSFHYCGTEIGQVRNVCGKNRARNDYEKIIRQGSLFSEIVLNNLLLKNAIGHAAMHRFICFDIEEELRSLYKLGRYSDYRSFYKKAIRDGRILSTRKFFKRFILSYLFEIKNKFLV